LYESPQALKINIFKKSKLRRLGDLAERAPNFQYANLRFHGSLAMALAGYLSMIVERTAFSPFRDRAARSSGSSGSELFRSLFPMSSYF
jgi:hypothetical protein